MRKKLYMKRYRQQAILESTLSHASYFRKKYDVWEANFSQLENQLSKFAKIREKYFVFQVNIYENTHSSDSVIDLFYQTCLIQSILKVSYF